MRNLLSILMLVQLLGAPFVSAIVPAEHFCTQAEDDCASESPCDPSCAPCLGCAGRALYVAATAVPEPVLTPPARPATPAIALPPQPQPTDILHVPRSI